MAGPPESPLHASAPPWRFPAQNMLLLNRPLPYIWIKRGFIINKTLSTVKTIDNVRGHFAAFVAFKAKNQCHIIILPFETLQFGFL